MAPKKKFAALRQEVLCEITYTNTHTHTYIIEHPSPSVFPWRPVCGGGMGRQRDIVMGRQRDIVPRGRVQCERVCV